MSDRQILEMAEARELVPSYYATEKKLGKEGAQKWLQARLQKLEKIYGRGFEDRCRQLMRQIHKGEE